MPLTVEIMTPKGMSMREEGLERIVVRRREPGFEFGGEVAIYPRHGPLLMETQACRMRLTQHGLTREFDAPAGVLEVLDDHVTLVVV